MTPLDRRSLTLRPAGSGDIDLLRGLYAQTRAAELELVPWDDASKTSFVDRQFAAQRSDYETRFPRSEHLVLLEVGEPVGRVWIDRRSDEIRLLDIIVDERRQRRGIGEAVIEWLIAEASAAGVALRHSVLASNDLALRFYRRHGFEIIEDFEMYVLMEWRRQVNSSG